MLFLTGFFFRRGCGWRTNSAFTSTSSKCPVALSTKPWTYSPSTRKVTSGNVVKRRHRRKFVLIENNSGWCGNNGYVYLAMLGYPKPDRESHIPEWPMFPTNLPPNCKDATAQSGKVSVWLQNYLRESDRMSYQSLTGAYPGFKLWRAITSSEGRNVPQASSLVNKP